MLELVYKNQYAIPENQYTFRIMHPRQTLSIVVPAYNEAASLPHLAEALHQAMAHQPYAMEIILVDDGSNDATPQVMERLSRQYPDLFYLRLSRNFGHQNALKAGLDYASGDAVISMDADMQHPPSLIPDMIAKWEEGFDIVYTRREDSTQNSLLKRVSSRLFYRTLNQIGSLQIEQGTADFRLLSRQVADILRTFQPSDLFFRGLVPWVGFSSVGIDYRPQDRFAGSSKYSFKKMVRLAIQGITSFSIQPLYLAVYLGVTLAIITLLYLPYALWQHLHGQTVSGWTSLIVTMTFLGGIQLIMIGILGIYLGKLFLQNKQRPAYLIRKSHLPKPPINL